MRYSQFFLARVIRRFFFCMRFSPLLRMRYSHIRAFCICVIRTFIRTFRTHQHFTYAINDFNPPLQPKFFPKMPFPSGSSTLA